MESIASEARSETRVAALLMEVAPQVMRRIRAEMRGHRAPGLTIIQLRAMTFLFRHQGASLSDLSEHIGLKLPAMSKAVDALVERDLVVRQSVPADRRYVSLSLSPKGMAEMKRTRRITESRLAEALSSLSPEEQARIAEALRILGGVFERPAQK